VTPSTDPDEWRYRTRLTRWPSSAYRLPSLSLRRMGILTSRQETPHAIPKNPAVLTAPRQRAMPEPSYLEPKDLQSILVQGGTP
jgi:hypothetical protein